MRRRDAAEGKASLTQRSRAPAFLLDDEEDDYEDDMMRRRRRRHYDEFVEKEEEEEIPLDQLAEARTDSLESWIALEPVRKSIVREFKNFLVTYTDMEGRSVYGERAHIVGDRECHSAYQSRYTSLTLLYPLLQAICEASRSTSIISLKVKQHWPSSSSIALPRCCLYSMTQLMISSSSITETYQICKRKCTFESLISPVFKRFEIYDRFI